MLRCSGRSIEVFCPKIRFERSRKSELIWTTEALFPGYIFAKFNYLEVYRLVMATRGVSKIVSFGKSPVIVSEEIISELRKVVSDQEVVTIQTNIEEGQEVKVVGGPFHGIRAVVSKVLSSGERIAILFKILGIEREIIFPANKILPTQKPSPIRKTDL